jgi:hypothetical protein
MSSNPLKNHFRQPQLYLKLPSQGKWWPKDSIDWPVTGELPVFSMTAKDELALKTPDALLNGQATVDVIQSCVPNIKNAWQTPVVDIDAILIAIRQATYGNDMEFVSVCPNCNNRNEHVADLGYLSSALETPNFNEKIQINDLEISIQPNNFETFNKNSIRNFEEQRLIQTVANDNISDEEKMLQFSKMFNTLLNITVEQVAASVIMIKTADGQRVTDTDHIFEFFQNCDKEIFNAVKDRIDSISKDNKLSNIEVQCENEPCKHQYNAPLIFELSSFFG